MVKTLPLIVLVTALLLYRNVDRLHAAPAAAAARSHGEGLARPEQPYLSSDAATKAAHQAWQPPERKDWRKVLTAKKHRAANKELFEEAEREQAARLIQVRECVEPDTVTRGKAMEAPGVKDGVGVETGTPERNVCVHMRVRVWPLRSVRIHSPASSCQHWATSWAVPAACTCQ